MLDKWEVPVLVVGIVQVIKLLVPALTEKGKLVIALLVGAVLFGTVEALVYLTPETQAIVLAVVRVIGYTIAAPGWFSVVKDEVVKPLTASQG